MKNRKMLGLVLSLALIIGVVVPGALAASAEDDGAAAGSGVLPVADAAPTEGGAPVEGEAPAGDAAPVEDDTAAEEDKTCTCAAAEDGTLTVSGDCPVHGASAETEKSAHTEGCSDDCAAEDCACPCHEKTLFERLMACETLEELFAIVDETPEEELLALTEEENAQIEAKIAALEPEPLPPVVIDGEAESDDEPVVSQIIYPAVNFANVAPFGPPVVG